MDTSGEKFGEGKIELEGRGERDGQVKRRRRRIGRGGRRGGENDD